MDKDNTADELILMIGPEGGFSENELELMQKNAIQLLSFGSTIMRAETAAISGISVLRWYFQQ